MADKSFLSLNLLSELRKRNITSLSQARRLFDHQSSPSFWISSTELGLSGVLVVEWDKLRRALIDSIAYFQDLEYVLLWIDGDNPGSLTVKITYLALLSTQGLSKVREWRETV